MAKSFTQAIKKKITAKDIICFPANLLVTWANTINPKNIAKSYAKIIKENKIPCVTALAIIVFVVIRIAFMDFDLSVFGISNTMFAGGTIDDVKKMLELESNLTAYGIRDIYDLFVPVGMSLSVLYWMIMFIGIAVRDQFTVEQIAIHMIRLIIPVWLISDKGYDIILYLIKIGDGIRNQLVSQLALDITGITDTGAGDLKVGLFNILNALIPLFCLWIIGMACKIVMMLTCYMRRLKVAVLVALAPIALSDVTGDQHSTSLRFLKNILALALQGALIVAIATIAMFILKQEAGGAKGVEGEAIAKLIADGTLGITDTIPIVAIGLTVLGIYPKTEDIAKTIIGAN